jgi:hypothetical protein
VAAAALSPSNCCFAEESYHWTLVCIVQRRLHAGCVQASITLETEHEPLPFL